MPERTARHLIHRLKALGNEENVAGMARFGINSDNTLGVPIPSLRGIAKEIGPNHPLALELWRSGIHEARLLAGFIDDPSLVTDTQMESWVKDFDSWDVCDQVCSNLFDKTEFAIAKTGKWTKSKKEFTKRAGFVLMASLAVHDKAAEDELFMSFLSIVKRECEDERNFVRKAVNWALRQIGKRNRNLNRAPINTAKEILKVDSKAARWIASDAIRELTGASVARKLKR